MDAVLKQFVDEILLAMEVRDVTRKELADMLGVSKGRVSAILTGTHPNITLKTLSRIAEALEKDVHFSLSVSGSPPQPVRLAD
jgi:transcriptional regulator with XRE-family HTH domain